MAARDLLLTDVLPRGHDTAVDVHVVDGRIAAVGPSLDAPAGIPRLDGGGRAVLPGLVEPHLHLDKALLDARRPGDGTLAGAVEVTAELKAGFTVDDVVDRAEDVLTRALRHGTTLIRTPVDVDPTVGLTGVEALFDVKQRWAGTVELQLVAFPQEGIAARPGTHDLLVEALRRGVDVIGACSYAEADVEGCREHLRTVFDLAERFGVPVDVHADFAADASDPRQDLAAEIAELTTQRGMSGRVVLGHVTTLAGTDAAHRHRGADALAVAGVGVVVLPPTDLYLQGYTAPLRELADAGVDVAFSSNNIRNAFTPFGTVDVLDVALLLAQTAPFPRAEELDDLLDRASRGAAAMIGSHTAGGGGHDLAPGTRADLVVLDGSDHRTALLDRAPRRWVISGGRVVAETETRTSVDAPVRARRRS